MPMFAVRRLVLLLLGVLVVGGVAAPQATATTPRVSSSYAYDTTAIIPSSAAEHAFDLAVRNASTHGPEEGSAGDLSSSRAVFVAADTADGAANAANGVRLRAQLTGEQIAGGHAFADHVVKAGEFPGITTRTQFAARIEEVVTNGESRELLRGCTAYWQGNTVVIRDPASVDGGTAFVPTGGYNYFLGLK